MTEKEFREELKRPASEVLRGWLSENNITRQAVIQLGNINPGIDAWLQLWRDGELTWEQMATGMVVDLHQRMECIRRIQKSLTKGKT